jgi:hypothetical protein|tara:strand:+ start:26 stop:334 length:309 start_codon:yes stop_codon:yes gene_type:complete
MAQNNIENDKDLGPDNKEARDLMEALHNTVGHKNLKYYEDENGPDYCINGVGRDIFGKYSYTEKIYKGKVYQIQVRDKDQIDNAHKHIKIGIQKPIEKRKLN